MDGGFEKFSKNIFDIILPLARRLLKEHRHDFEQAIGNELLKTNGPKSIDRELSPPELFIRKIVNGYQEISDSFENLENIEIYIRRFPYRGTRITPIAYLRFNMENYFHELYVLYERLKAYLKIIQRIYQKNSDAQTIKSVLESLQNNVCKVFEVLVRIRGSHVHVTRFEDTTLRRLSLLELLSRGDIEFKILYQNAYKEARHEIVLSIKNNNGMIREILDAYFEILNSIVFDDTRQLRFPKGISVLNSV